MIKRHTNSTAMKQGKLFSVFLQEIRSQNTRKRKKIRKRAHIIAIMPSNWEMMNPKLDAMALAVNIALALYPIEKHSQKQWCAPRSSLKCLANQQKSKKTHTLLLYALILDTCKRTQYHRTPSPSKHIAFNYIANMQLLIIKLYVDW